MPSLIPLPFQPRALLDRLQDAVSSARLPILDVQDLVTPLGLVRTLNLEYATSTIHWPSNELVEAEMHLKALHKLIEQRGGLLELRSSPNVLRVVIW